MPSGIEYAKGDKMKPQTLEERSIEDQANAAQAKYNAAIEIAVTEYEADMQSVLNRAYNQAALQEKANASLRESVRVAERQLTTFQEDSDKLRRENSHHIGTINMMREALARADDAVAVDRRIAEGEQAFLPGEVIEISEESAGKVRGLLGRLARIATQPTTRDIKRVPSIVEKQAEEIGKSTVDLVSLEQQLTEATNALKTG
jgi:hypothetical protein